MSLKKLYRDKFIGINFAGTPLTYIEIFIIIHQNIMRMFKERNGLMKGLKLLIGVIRQTRHSASLDGVVGKASAGALASVRIATVVNIARAVEALKSANVWTIGLAGDADAGYTDVDWTLPSALVLGAEGAGMRRLVRETCDRVVRIPMRGAVDSLNVSVAAGVVLYEAVRQREDGAVRQGSR